MKKEHWMYLAAGVGIVAGFYLAGATSTSGIFANSLTSTPANWLYGQGLSLAGSAAA